MKRIGEIAMIKKVIKYTDFNGNENEEVAYFNLTKSECARMEMGTEGGLSKYMMEVVESGDNKKLIELFDKVILDSYGVKSEDGKRFVKTAEMREQFAQSLAYDELFMEIASNPEYAEAFMRGIVPAQGL